MTWLRRFLHGLLAILDDAAPMPPDQRAERDWTPDTSEAESARRRLRLRLHGFEKSGKGGFR